MGPVLNQRALSPLFSAIAGSPGWLRARVMHMLACKPGIHGVECPVRNGVRVILLLGGRTY